MSLPANIRVGWKDMTGSSTLAYCKNQLITDVKRFITLAPGVDLIKLFGHKLTHTFL
jgi:hypothetical protein